MPAHKTHGMKNTPEYMAWNQMKQRCFNTKHKAYPRYGGRGIKVCERWETFENFFADIVLRPSKNHSLDRYPEKLGDYKPGNVRWATRLQQQNNMRSNRIVIYKNREITFAQAWRISPKIVSLNTAYQRLDSGWPITKSLETPSEQTQ